MGMLPFAVRGLAEMTIWSTLALYIIANASSIDTSVLTQLNNEKAQIYLDTLMNSPYCLAYDKNVLEETKDVTTGQTISINQKTITKGGVIDLTKFYNTLNQNCLRKSEVWDNGVQITGEEKLCGWALLSFIDWNDDCPEKQECSKSGVCVPKGTLKNMGPSEGTFITYEVKLKDDKDGKEYSFISYEQGARLVYQPAIQGKGKGSWGDDLYFEYLTCDSNFGARKVTASSPVVIALPKNNGEIEEHLGIIDIEMCIGTYGKPKQ